MQSAGIPLTLSLTLAKCRFGGFAFGRLRGPCPDVSKQLTKLQLASSYSCMSIEGHNVPIRSKSARHSTCEMLKPNGVRCFGSLGAGQKQVRPVLNHDGGVVWKIGLRGAATKRKEVVQRQNRGQESSLAMSEKVKQAGKDAGYTGVFIIGFGVTGLMFFAIGRELLSGNSPNGVYTRAYKMCKNCDELSDAIGHPIKGYGEMSRRGRRRHTNHTEFEVDGVKVMRMKFYVEGPMGKGTTQLEVRQDDGGKYNFRYLFVTLDQYPFSTIIIEDNR